MKYFIAVLCLAYVATASADKCTDVYQSCVNATGSDPMSRLKCGMKYLRCRFNDMRSDEDFDELFDGEDKPECKVGFRDCMKAAQGADDKYAAMRVCFKNKYVCAKENVKDKLACLKKCKDADGMKGKAQCAAQCFKKEEEDEDFADELFDGEDKPEPLICKVGLFKCMNAAKNAEDKKAAMKVCFQNKAACIKQYAKDKYACLKKCKDADGMKGKAQCVAQCFKKEKEEDFADELFDGEDKPEPLICKVGLFKCMNAAKDAEDKKAAMKVCFQNKAACIKQYAKDKYACLKKCKDADGMKGKAQCVAQCFKKEKEEDFADELFDGEEKSCRAELKQCMDNAKDFQERGQCIDAAKKCAKDKLQPKIDCVNKCREELKACGASGSSRLQCGYQFYKCVKPCKDA